MACRVEVGGLFDPRAWATVDEARRHSHAVSFADTHRKPYRIVDVDTGAELWRSDAAPRQGGDGSGCVIVGLSGRKQAGKGTVAEFLRVNAAAVFGRSAVVQPLALPLKRFCREVLGLTQEQCYGTDAAKNSPTRFGKTAREVLQHVGTDLIRKHYPGVWTDYLIRRAKIDPSGRVVIVDDVRFADEVEAIQAAGGKVIRLTRAPFADTHASETALDNYGGFDCVIASNLTARETCVGVAQYLNPKVNVDELRRLPSR